MSSDFWCQKATSEFFSSITDVRASRVKAAVPFLVENLSLYAAFSSETALASAWSRFSHRSPTGSITNTGARDSTSTGALTGGGASLTTGFSTGFSTTSGAATVGLSTGFSTATGFSGVLGLSTATTGFGGSSTGAGGTGAGVVVTIRVFSGWDATGSGLAGRSTATVGATGRVVFLGNTEKPTAAARTAAAAAARGIRRRGRDAATTRESRISFTGMAGGASIVDAIATARRHSSQAARWEVR